MTAKQIIYKDMDIDIKGITLLSREEFEKNKEWIPATLNKTKWWLRSKGCCDDYACYVDSNTNLICDDGYIDLAKDVRPVLLFKTTAEINPGDEFILFARYCWVVLETTLNGNFMAISLESIGRPYFNEYGKSNDYENSEIKKYLEEKLKSWIDYENR